MAKALVVGAGVGAALGRQPERAEAEAAAVINARGGSSAQLEWAPKVGPSIAVGKRTSGTTGSTVGSGDTLGLPAVGPRTKRIFLARHGQVRTYCFFFWP